jgi:hypothetical protein
MRAEALLRLQKLHSILDNQAIAKRLYNDNRCGIAHGGTIKRHDLADDFVEIAKDLKLIRYLARIAIEERL